MKTITEIINKHKSVERRQSSGSRLFGGYDFTYLNIGSAGIAMEEWAREIAIDFEKWRRRKEKEGYTGLIASTPSRLFDKYLKEKSQ